MSDSGAERGWGGRIRDVGEAFLGVVRAEIAALAVDLGRSGRALLRVFLVAIAAAGVLFWTLGLLIYLAIELVSLPSYILAGFRRGDRRSSEAALKYVIYGAAASGLMLYGFSLLYGLTGTLSCSLADLARFTPRQTVPVISFAIATSAATSSSIINAAFVCTGLPLLCILGDTAATPRRESL